ncbi:hypothetical protein CVT24_012209 [Panaeolus cyanescens]|uniref:Uncharacterized protein n=1 Tax=Panaeolus cyanescens TaxID=181874 RepID=A0A409YIU8_9AGAR|nr:hypothetical protein CVT24_012209 [Panaeolus cyanescens]
MPGLTISRSKAPLLNKIKVALSRTKGPKDASALPIPAQAASVSLLSEPGAGTEPPEPLHPVLTSSSDINYLEASPAILPASTTTVAPVAQQEAPLTINRDDLPPEILAEIFHTYMFWEDKSHLMDPHLEGMISVFVPDSRSAPLLFCGVCGYWRDIAIATPVLWSALAIQTSFNLDIISLWLKRSQGHPLSLYVSIDWDSPSHMREQTPRLMELLYATMPRWQQVSVHLTEAIDMRRFLFTLIPEEGKSPAAILQYLHISADYDVPDLLNHDSFSRLSSFPHPTLRRLTWSNYESPGDFAQVSPFLWTNLQQISFLMLTTADLHSFLKTCKMLQFISIHALHTLVMEGEAITPTVSHTLQSLSIDHVVGDLTDAIALLATPNLRKLTIGPSSSRGHANGLEDFLERSRCKLESLCIVCRTTEFDEVEARIMLHMPIFNAIPHLSLRLLKGLCHPSFPQAIISETAEKWKETAYAQYEHKTHSYHLGWGTLDLAHFHLYEYPFLVKSHIARPKWLVGITDGPLTCA